MSNFLYHFFHFFNLREHLFIAPEWTSNCNKMLSIYLKSKLVKLLEG